jgi:GT2 family glycosyltransferase
MICSVDSYGGRQRRPSPTAPLGAAVPACAEGSVSIGHHDTVRELTASVVLCTYTDRRWHVLVEALASVLAQRPAPHEVLLVIDHDEELLWRARRELRSVRVVPNQREPGLSGARNTGVEHASGDVVVFLDDDAIPHPGWLDALVDALDRDDVVGAGGPVIPRWATAKPPWFPEEFLWVVGCSYRGAPEERGPIRNPIGANMSFRRSACLDVGGFAVRLGRVGSTPLGCEETELAIRLRASRPDTAIIHVPSARVEHLVTAERVRFRYFWTRCWGEGLSKALVTTSVGTDAGLESERRYVARTLWRGVKRALRDATHGDGWGVARAGAIVVGLAITTAGFVRGRIVRAGQRAAMGPPSRQDGAATR